MTYKKLFVTCLLFITGFVSYAQCPTEELVFGRQGQVDSFAILYPECDSLKVKLRLNSPFGQITNLEGLRNLVYASELVLTQVHGLKDLSGLENLRQVGNLHVFNCYGLESVDDVAQIEKADEISLVFNSNLLSIRGFDKIDSLTSLNLTIQADSSLTIEGFQNLKYLKSLALGGNTKGQFPALEYVEGISFANNSNMINDIEGIRELVPQAEGVESIEIYFQDSFSLIGVHHFENIKSLRLSDIMALNMSGMQDLDAALNEFRVEFSGTIISLDALRTISAKQLRFIGTTGLDKLPNFSSGAIIESAIIFQNPNLADISGLDSLNSLNFVNIRQNPKLEVCNYTPICRILKSDTLVAQISNNAPGCNSLEEVEEQCVTSTYSHELNEELYIFPNPVSHTLQIMGADQFESSWTEFGIFSISGQVLRSGALNGNSVDVSSLPPGMYFLVLERNGQVLPLKFVKE